MVNCFPSWPSVMVYCRVVHFCQGWNVVLFDECGGTKGIEVYQKSYNLFRGILKTREVKCSGRMCGSPCISKFNTQIQPLFLCLPCLIKVDATKISGPW